MAVISFIGLCLVAFYATKLAARIEVLEKRLALLDGAAPSTPGAPAEPPVA